ncbi:MAG TPA: ROK family protein [Candidatus Aminicenantes bacterium]|nr:ROK family protein [Candidatus Aminicenantes bacterium]HRY64665.1 ROK family protein [Candidatus Aminicenantes bacterium]HRZ71578.1 ROK family protein [Candidatus Aminicenantes bacterium]
MSRYAVGIDLGGTKVEACLVDETRRVLARKRRPSEPGLGRERVVANILGLVAETAGGARVEAVGLGTPGTYSAADDIMYGAPHTPLYEKPGLVSLLRSGLAAPLVVENDANCLALAEFFAQCHGRYSSVLAVILGTGMGAGLILDNRLHRGPHGNAGEIGHTSIAIDGRPCECGRHGCGEAYLSGPSLGRRYAELAGETLTPDRIYARYEAGEPSALRVFDDSVRIMAELFANCVNALDLEAVVLGGGVSNLPLWYERVPPLLAGALFGTPGRTVPVLKAVLGDSAGVLGAAYLALREMRLMTF